MACEDSSRGHHGRAWPVAHRRPTGAYKANAEVAARLENAALAAIKSSAIQDFMKKGELRGTLNSQEFRARIDNDTAHWRPMLATLGISAEGTTTAPLPK